LIFPTLYVLSTSEEPNGTKVLLVRMVLVLLKYLSECVKILNLIENSWKTTSPTGDMPVGGRIKWLSKRVARTLTLNAMQH
jgi:hypothetical protein